MYRKLSIVLSFLVLALAIAPAAADALEVESAEGWLHDSAGAPLLRAGAHPDFKTTIHLSKLVNPDTGIPAPDGNPKDIEVTLPPGLVGNPTAVPTCTQAELSALPYFADCSPSAQVGIATLTSYSAFGAMTASIAVYNMVPPQGVAAEFAFNFVGVIVHIDSGVVADPSVPGGYRVKTTIGRISQGIAIGDTALTLWGAPASHAHDNERTPRGSFGPGGTVVESEVATQRALMTNPTSCAASAQSMALQADSWQAPGLYSTTSFDHDPQGNPFIFTDCNQVPFEASLEVQPTTTQADSPTGLDVNLTLPQNEVPEGIASADLRDAVVTLPEGMAVDASSAGGLGSCAPAQIGLGNDNQPSCPSNSKIGSVQIVTPLLSSPLAGSVYLAQQGQNKFGSLLALYLVIDDPVTGVRLKIPGKVETDPTSGRLVARFTEAPQLPVKSLNLRLADGPRAALVTPPACGTYATQGEFTPWSGNASVVSTDTFRIDQGPGGGPCPSGQFDPSLKAGTANPAAGAYSPFEVQIARPDGSGRLSTVSLQLPKGLLAKLSGIPYCSDAALGGVPTGEGTGAAQLATPSCPTASRIGSVAVAAGAGQSPFWVKTGAAYLAGPYKGAPLSLAIITPALAGPFDLGNVVVRTALQVNPETAQVTVVSDPLPTILHGIPIDLREVRVTLDANEFTLNPTSCGPASVNSTITGTAGATASPSSRFQVASCAGLAFKPKVALRLSGAPPRRGASPALRATVTPASGDANIGKASVILPGTELLEQGHIKTVCTRVQFAANQCPAGSIYGYAKAWTPLLAQPLEGPVYLRSNGGERKLPDLVADLNGQIHVVLVGYIDSVKRHGSPRIRTRFVSVPDAPVSRFVLEMQRGKKSLLANTTNLCKAKARAEASLTGQNGRKHETRPLVKVEGCGGKQSKAQQKSGAHKK